MSRSCDNCDTPLTGRKRQGWVTNDGRQIKCVRCTFPKRKFTGKRR